MHTPATAGRPRLRVVIVHWNQPHACVDTVARFLDQDPVSGVTVVDNGSCAASLAELHEGLEAVRARLCRDRDDGSAAPDGRSDEHPCTEADRRIEVVETGQNLGFGPGANVGLRHVLADAGSGDWIALAPHDVDPAPGCLAAMLDAADGEPMAGLMCADVGDAMTPVIDPYFGGMTVAAADPDPTQPRWEPVDYPHGTLMLLRRRCLDEVGVFDERYFSYCEEADLALRARRAGWSVGLVRGARVTNVHVGSSIRLVDYLQTRNTLLLVREMSGRYHAFIRACFTLVQTWRGWRDPSTRPLIFDARARLTGLRDFVLGRFGPPPASVTAEPTQLDPR